MMGAESQIHLIRQLESLQDFDLAEHFLQNSNLGIEDGRILQQLSGAFIQARGLSPQFQIKKISWDDPDHFNRDELELPFV